MKTAEKKINPEEKVIEEATNRTGTVKVRMKDFYPGYCGEQEYCEVSREFYDEFYAKKVPQTETITVKTRDFYPHLYHRIKSETLTMPKDLYDEIMEYRAVNDEVAIWVNDYYKENRSEKKYALVSRKVYRQLERFKEKDSYDKEKDKDMYVPFEYDEASCAAVNNIYTDSGIKNVEIELMLNSLLDSLGKKYVDIGKRYFIDGESPKSIANNLELSCNVVWKALRIIKQTVKNAGYYYFFAE